MVIKSVKPLSVAKVAGVLYALIGLIAGACFSLLGVALSSFASNSDNHLPPMLGAMFGAGAIIILPIVYGIFGFIFALIGAFIYNIVAGIAGGIEIETA